MGMLQLAGIVSGGGKALQRGLENTQQYMTYSMLQEERNQMELKRMDITYGRERGLLHERATLERNLMTDRANLENKFATERDDRTHTQAMGRLEKEYDLRGKGEKDKQTFETTQAELKRKQDLEDAERKRKESLEDSSRKTREEIEKETREDKRNIAKEGRDDKRKEKQFQAEVGKEITLETLRGQRPTAAGSKLDPQTNAQLNVLKGRIERLTDEFNNVMTTDERRAQIQKEIATLEGQQNSLTGIQSPQSTRKPFVDPFR